MADSSYFDNNLGSTPNINGLTPQIQTPLLQAHSQGPGQQKKWQHYKLLIDPQIKKGQQKLYRYDGVVPGPMGADFSVKLLRDPRSRLTRLWKGREKLDLPVPKFKYDAHYVGELPPKQVTFTNLNDNVREGFLRSMCEKYGTIEDVTIYHNPKSRKHLGLATVGFSTTRAAKNCVNQLNRTSVMGNIIIVQVDAGGKECERIFDCLVSGKVNTPSSISTTPRDPRHTGGSIPPTPDSISTPTKDPRRASLEAQQHDAFNFQGPQGVSTDLPPPPPFPQDGGAQGLSHNFHGMNVHDAGAVPGPPGGGAPQVPYGNFGQPVLDQYGNPQGPFVGSQQQQQQHSQHGAFPQQQQHQGNFPARTENYHDPHQQGWDQGYQQQDVHHQRHGAAAGYSHQRGSEVADPRHGYHGNKHHQQQHPNATSSHWEQTHSGSSGQHHETNTHMSHRGDSSRYGSHGHRTDSKSESSDYHSRSHHHHGDRRHSRERKDSYKDRHKSRHSMTRDSSRESSRSDRSLSPPPPAPPPPPPPKEPVKPVAAASKEPKKDVGKKDKEDEESTSLDLRIEQLLNQSKMSFSFDLESSQNSSTGSGTARRDSIGSETKDTAVEAQKDIPGGDLYEEFSDEDFEVDQELDDRGGIRDDCNRDDQRSNDRGNKLDRNRGGGGGRGNRDGSRDRRNKYSPDRGRDYSPERSHDRFGDKYRDRDRHHRDPKDRGSKHKHRSHRHRWKDDHQPSSERRGGGRSKYSRDDNSDSEYGDYRQKDKYSDRGGPGYSRRDRRSSLDRDESVDSYHSKLEFDESNSTKRNDLTPTEDEVQVVEEVTSSLVSKGIASLRKGCLSKDSPYGIANSPAMEVSIIGTDSQGSTPLTAEPSTSDLMTPMQDTTMVSDISGEVPPPPPPRSQDHALAMAPPQSTVSQWNVSGVHVAVSQAPAVKPNQSHAQLANLAKAAAAYAQSKLALEQSSTAGTSTNLNIPPVPPVTPAVPPVVPPAVPPAVPYPGNVGGYGVAGTVQQPPGVYGTPTPQGHPQQQGTTTAQPAAAYPWMGVTGSSPYGQHLQQHSIYHMQMMTRMGLWQQSQSTTLGQNQLQQNQWAMQTPAIPQGVGIVPTAAPGVPQTSQPWLSNFPQQPHNVQQHQGPNQWGAMQSQPRGFPNNQQFPMSPYGNFPQQDHMFMSPPRSDPVEEMSADILEEVVQQLKVIMKKDLCRKMVETSAFKSLENWWDECEKKSKIPLKSEEELDQEWKKIKEEAAKTPPKKRPILPHIPSLLDPNLLDSNAWAKNFAESKTRAMEGGMGLGFRATMPKMPSFKRNRKPPTPKFEVKKNDHRKKGDQDMSDTEKDKEEEKDDMSSRGSEPDTEGVTTQEKRKKWGRVLSEDEEEEEEEEEEDDDDEEDDESEEDEEDEEEEEDEEVEDEDDEEDEEEEDEDVEVEVEIEKDEDEEMMAELEELKKEMKQAEGVDSDEESEMSDSDESSASSGSSSEESESEDEGQEEQDKKEDSAASASVEEKISLQKEDEEIDVDVEESDEDEEETEKTALNGEVSDRSGKPLERISEEEEKEDDEDDSSESSSSDEKQDESSSKEDGDDSTKISKPTTDEERDMGAFELLVELATKAKPETIAEKAAAEKAKLSEDAAVPVTQDKEELEAAELLQSMKRARVSLKRISSLDGLPSADERTESSEKAATPKAPGKKQPAPAEVRVPKVPASLRRRLAAGFPDLQYLADMMSDEDEEETESHVPVELGICEEEVVGVDVTAYDFVDEVEEMDTKEKEKEQPTPSFLDEHSYCIRPPPSPPKPVRLDKTKRGLPLPDISAELPTEQAAGSLPLAGRAITPSPTSTLTAEETVAEEEASRKRKLEEIEHMVEEAAAIPEPTTPKHDQRNYYEEWSILYKFLSEGIDHEDAYFLRKSYENMLEDSRIPWLNYTHWVPHPLTKIPNPKKKRKKNQPDDELHVHASGCGRTEGYYKITLKEKMKYLTKVDRIEEHNRQRGDNMLSASAKHSIELSREARSDQRRVIAALQAQEGSTGSDLLRFNQLKFRKKQLKFSKSGIHGWGLYAMENIASDEMVIEYVGQSVRQILADEREVIYGKKGIGSSYLFRIDGQSIIDATLCGNLARFINHSCNPNCYAKIITVESEKKIVIYSKQNIAQGEEITYDYKFPIEDDKIICLCGASGCRGTLN